MKIIDKFWNHKYGDIILPDTCIPDKIFGYIYFTYCVTNGMKYVGEHYSKEARLDDSYLGSGKVAYEKIKENSKENYIKVIIDYALSRKELDEKESYWIAYFNAAEREDFYNIGTGASTNDNFTYHPEYDKVLLSLRESYKSPERSRKLSEAQKRKTPWNKGVPMTEEAKRQSSEAHKGQVAWNKGLKMSEEAVNKNSEAQIKQYNSEAGKVRKQRISASLKGRSLSEDACKNISEGHKEFYKTEKGKALIESMKTEEYRDKFRGEKNPMYGKHWKTIDGKRRIYVYDENGEIKWLN